MNNRNNEPNSYKTEPVDYQGVWNSVEQEFAPSNLPVLQNVGPVMQDVSPVVRDVRPFI